MEFDLIKSSNIFKLSAFLAILIATGCTIKDAQEQRAEQARGDAQFMELLPRHAMSPRVDLKTFVKSAESLNSFQRKNCFDAIKRLASSQTADDKVLYQAKMDFINPDNQQKPCLFDPDF